MKPAFVDKRSPSGISLFSRLARAVDDFFFREASARPLGALRIGLAGVLIAQAWMVRTEILEFFARDGIVQDEPARYFSVPGAPHLAWLTERLAPFGVSEAFSVHAVCGVYLVSLLLLAVGAHTRLAAVLAWFLHFTLMNTGHASIYGIDRYAHIFLFYLMCLPAGNAFSLDAALHPARCAPTIMARLGLRVAQLHLCVSYLASGIEKSTGAQWWNGELLWRVLSLPEYQQFDMSWLAEWPWLSRIGGWATLAIELGYCIFIWPRRTRKLWIAATVALHLGIAIFLGLPLFGIIMCVLTVALFGFSAEPHTLSPLPRSKGVLA
jgi:hypothetical protein